LKIFSLFPFLLFRNWLISLKYLALSGEIYELENQFLKQQLESEIARHKETNEKVIKLQEQLEKYRAASESPTIGNTGELISEEVSMLRYFILIR